MRHVCAILLLGCLNCCAQFGVEQPFLSAQVVTSQSGSLPAGLYFWWNYTNQADGTVSTWPDLVQAASWSMSGSPIKSTNGILFDSAAKYGSMSAWPQWTNYSFGLTIEITGQHGNYSLILNDNGGGVFGPLGVNANTNFTWRQIPYSSMLPTGLVDIIVTQDKYNTDQRAVLAYTNGVLSVSNSYSFAVSEAIVRLGSDSFGDHADFYVREIPIWTNRLSPDDVAQYHSYRTNTYGGSP